MKQIVLIITLVLITISGHAQDIITLKNGARINSNVIQIKDDNVFFKYFDNPNGSTYSVKTNDVSQILYKNGRVESFETNSTRQQTTPPVRTQSQSRQPATTPTNSTPDIITMTYGHKINAFVREITQTQVLFNLFIEPNGELYYVNKNDVASILYRDGKTESFAVAYTETPAYRQSPTQTTQPVAQSQQRQRKAMSRKIFYVTPKIGLNKSFQDERKYIPQIGIDVGCTLEWAFTSFFSFESGLLYSNRKYEQSHHYTVYGQHPLFPSVEHFDFPNTKDNTHCFLIPLYPKFFIYKGFNVFAGIQFGICTYPDYSVWGGILYKDRGYDAPLTVSCLGLGYLFNSGLSVSLSYNHTFENYTPDALNRTFHTHIGWRF